jgi:hypothetical protein
MSSKGPVLDQSSDRFYHLKLLLFCFLLFSRLKSDTAETQDMLTRVCVENFVINVTPVSVCCSPHGIYFVYFLYRPCLALI